MNDGAVPVDAHHHLWDTSVRDYPWMDGAWADPLRGRFDAARYAEVTRPHRVAASVVVQALHDLDETYELLRAAGGPAGPDAGTAAAPTAGTAGAVGRADRAGTAGTAAGAAAAGDAAAAAGTAGVAHGPAASAAAPADPAGRVRIAGVVGWVDLTRPGVADELAAVRAGPAGDLLVGVRHQAQDEPDPGWLLRRDVMRGIAAAGAAGLVYDLLVRPPQADAALDLARRLPEVSFVLDHAGKPDIAHGVWEPWATWITALAALPNVAVKLSGLVTEAAPGWTPADVLPYARHVLDVFGPDRVMFGSDWPVCTLAASYAQVLALAEEAVPAGDRNAVFGGTARRVYGIG